MIYSIEVIRVIERPIEEMFRFLGNSENNPKWLGRFEEVQKTSEGPLGVGTTYKDVARMMGRRFETESEVTEFVPNRLYARRITKGPFDAEVRIEFEPAGEGTKVRLLSKADLRGAFRLIAPVLRRSTERQLQDGLDKAKAMMEASA